jgi:hypothetical protein
MHASQSDAGIPRDQKLRGPLSAAVRVKAGLKQRWQGQSTMPEQQQQAFKNAHPARR